MLNVNQEQWDRYYQQSINNLEALAPGFNLEQPLAAIPMGKPEKETNLFIMDEEDFIEYDPSKIKIEAEETQFNKISVSKNEIDNICIQFQHRYKQFYSDLIENETALNFKLDNPEEAYLQYNDTLSMDLYQLTEILNQNNFYK